MLCYVLGRGHRDSIKTKQIIIIKIYIYFIHMLCYVLGRGHRDSIKKNNNIIIKNDISFICYAMSSVEDDDNDS